MVQTDQGILLNRISYGETSLITTFFTRKNGIQKYIFQGGKKKAGNLFPLGIYELTFYTRPDSELGKINQANVDPIIHEIIGNPVKSVISFFISEILLQSIKTNDQDIELFEYLKNEIYQLSIQKQVTSFPALFLLRYMEYLGINPLVIDDKATYFDLENGEITNNPKSFLKAVNSEAVVFIRDYFLNREFTLNELENHRKEIISILLSFLMIHIPHFKGQKILDMAKEILI